MTGMVSLGPLEGAGRTGGVREKWTEETMKVAAAAVLGRAGIRKVDSSTARDVAAAAQDRDGWKRAVKAWYKKFDWESFALFHSRGVAGVHAQAGTG